MDLTRKLSPHFTLRELCRSDTAVRMGIDNTPTEEYNRNLVVLCEEVLEKVRERFGPVRINSGYRSLACNMAVNPISNIISKISQHCTGCAAVFEVDGVANGTVAQWCIDNLPEWDQLILEFYVPGQPNSGWVHVSYVKGKNRKQVLTAVKENGKTVYIPGIVL